MKTILLIGETGNGKSSLGNCLIGKECFKVSNDPKSCTKEVLGQKSLIDKDIFVIDTPGFQDSSGNDRKNFDKILNYIIKHNSLELILLVFNFQAPRFNLYYKNLIKFLCNAFPKNFSHHVGFIFTNYDHNYQLKINKKNKIDPRETKKKKYVPEIMKLISQTTNEKIFLSPPIFFLDSYGIEGDDYSKKEMTNLIYFTKTLKPIDIYQKKDLFIKEEIIETDRRPIIEENDDEIITKTYFYSRKKQIFYDGNVNYTDWEYLYYHTKTEEKEKKIVYKNNNDDDAAGLITIAALGIGYGVYKFLDGLFGS